jgi:hypothetical protein
MGAVRVTPTSEQVIQINQNTDNGRAHICMTIETAKRGE